jgi:Skp family chaperone for outer membrane proteins
LNKNISRKPKPNAFSSAAWRNLNGSVSALCVSKSVASTTDQHVIATAPFALYMRYQANHERAFYKALKELQTLRKERNNEQIGFEAQQRVQAAETRAVEAHNWKKQEFELKENRVSAPLNPKKRKRRFPHPPLRPNRT